jgi:hypothetical protein
MDSLENVLFRVIVAIGNVSKKLVPRSIGGVIHSSRWLRHDGLMRAAFLVLLFVLFADGLLQST